jgi:hypothetical protein
LFNFNPECRVLLYTDRAVPESDGFDSHEYSARLFNELQLSYQHGLYWSTYTDSGDVLWRGYD